MIYKILIGAKRLLNHVGYDIRTYRPVFEHTILPLGIRTVIDIGANTGRTAREYRKLFGKAEIHSFEPLPRCYEALVKTMEGDAHFHPYNVALGEEAGTILMDESSFHPSSSLLPMTALHKRLYPKSAQLTKKEVRIERLDNILDRSTITGPMFVKIDVQGFEDRVIRGGKAILAQAHAIQIETSFVTLYEGQPLFDDIYRLLTDLGFSYYGDVGRHYSLETGKLIYEESLFIKKELINA